MTSISKMLAAAAIATLTLSTASVAEAGRGGSNARLVNSYNTGSATAVIAELERAERLVCGSCIDTVKSMLDDDRYEVREAAAWWFARRPALKRQLSDSSIADLYGNDSIKARNAADILGTFRHPVAIDALSQAATRTDLSAEARAHAVRALGIIAHMDGTPALATAMGDSDATVRLEAVTAWLDVRHQPDAAPVIDLIDDTDILVRRKAAAVVGGLKEVAAVSALVAQLDDPDPAVRRNAVWSLGEIGDSSARDAVSDMTDDPSSLVRRTATAALRRL